MQNNKVKAKMDRGEKVAGAFFQMGSPLEAEILGILGLDFIMIDTEHGPFEIETTRELVTACENRGMEPFVRVKDFNRNSILKMLDIGAMGLLIPFIKTIDQVKELVSYGKYRPVGDKGFGGGRKAAFAMDPIFAKIEDYFEWHNRETLLIPQCETVEALEQIEDIVAIDGVDGIFIGPFDLSIAMGIPQQFNHPDFQAAIKRVCDACHAAGKFCWILGSNDDMATKFDMGFDGVLSGDTGFLTAGAVSYIKAAAAYNAAHQAK